MTGLSFAPLLPLPVLAALGGLALLICLLSAWRRARGTLLRLLGFLVLLATLCGPSWIRETTTRLPDAAIVLVDRSQSMAIGDRAALAARALAHLQATAGATRLLVVPLPPAPAGGTSLEPALQRALATLDPGQLAGIVAITDGEVSGLGALPSRVPFTALLTAKGEETDRELHLLDSPEFGLVGQLVPVSLVVLDHGVADAGTLVPVTLSADGATLASQPVPVGTPVTLHVPIRHAGPIVVSAAVPPLAGEVSLVNNQAAYTLTGIHQRLNVLLISGRPNQGERAWRLLLKSDPAIQLVHFTILRLPGEVLDAEARDVALVPFPVQELFEADLPKFDLIILDQFNPAGLLPPNYLGNIAQYVRNGGALFTEVGPEFAGPDSLAYSPLAPALPAIPAAPGTLTTAFAPQTTPLGARHPVTAPFAGAPLAPWYRMEAATPAGGQVLMTGAGGLPLLLLGDFGKGRSGILLSDQFWLWTRGGDHAGPAAPLLRRIIHYLLREPDLAPEALSAAIAGDHLTITRRTLSAEAPGPASVTAPDGTVSQVAFSQTGPGRYAAQTVLGAQDGVWQVRQGGLTAEAASTPANPQEFRDLAATASRVAPRATATVWLGRSPAPDLGSLLAPRHARAVTGLRTAPALPPWPGVLLALALFVAAWVRESLAAPELRAK